MGKRCSNEANHNEASPCETCGWDTARSNAFMKEMFGPAAVPRLDISTAEAMGQHVRDAQGLCGVVSPDGRQMCILRYPHPDRECGWYVSPDGASLIADERLRQIAEEGWTAEHDDEHDSGQMAMMAVCYAAPERIYIRRDVAIGLSFADPSPWQCDKRFSYGERRTNPGNVPPDPLSYSDSERIDLLVKAGALIAAEIDRLVRARTRRSQAGGGDGTQDDE